MESRSPFAGNRRSTLGFLLIRTEGEISWRYFMSSLSFHSSSPDRWVKPKPYSDSSLRYQMHGKIQPMEEPGFLARLFGLR